MCVFGPSSSDTLMLYITVMWRWQRFRLEKISTQQAVLQVSRRSICMVCHIKTNADSVVYNVHTQVLFIKENYSIKKHIQGRLINVFKSEMMTLRMIMG